MQDAHSACWILHGLAGLLGAPYKIENRGKMVQQCLAALDVATVVPAVICMLARGAAIERYTFKQLLHLLDTLVTWDSKGTAVLLRGVEQDLARIFLLQVHELSRSISLSALYGSSLCHSAVHAQRIVLLMKVSRCKCL